MKAAGLVLVVLCAGAGAWWLLRDEVPSTTPRVGGSDEAAAPEAPPILVTAASAPTAEASQAAPNRFAGITDLQPLYEGLWLNAQREEAVARWLELIRQDPSLLRTLLRHMHPDHDPERGGGQSIQRGVTAVLLALGPGTLDLLLEELNDDNAVYRTRMVALIGGFREKAAHVAPELMRRMQAVAEDPPAGEVASYVYALAWIGPAAKGLVPRLVAWLDGEQPTTEEIDVAAIQALTLIGGPNDALFGRYSEILRDPRLGKQRGAVLHQLRNMGKDGASMIPELLAIADEQLLSEGDVFATLTGMRVPDEGAVKLAEERLRATTMKDYWWGPYARYLAALGGAYRRSLLAIAQEKGPGFRVQLTQPMLRAGVPHREILEVLRPILLEGPEPTRREAWYGVSQLDQVTCKDFEAECLGALSAKDDADLRMAALGTAGIRRPLTPRLAAAILQRLEDPEEARKSRAHAAEILGNGATWATPRFYDAVVALSRQAPELDVLTSLAPFLPTRTREVLGLWAEDAKTRKLAPRIYGGYVTRLPRAVRLLHSTAVRKLGVDPDTGKWLADPRRVQTWPRR